MNELVVIDPQGDVRRFPLNFDELTVGRDPKCHVPLDDQRVSRRHARIYRGEKGHYIEDLGSANGVMLDGRLIRSPSLLQVGTKLEIGDFVLTVVPEGAAAGVEKANAQLRGLAGPYKNKEFDIGGTRVSVGRVEGNQIIVDDPSVSRHHARLQKDAGKYTLVDLGSSNGSFINDRPVTQQILKAGDKVTFGSVSFRFILDGKARRSGPAPILVYALAFGLVLIAVAVALALVLREPQQSEEAKLAMSLKSEMSEALSLGKVAMANEDWDEAIKQYDRVLAKDLTHAESRGAQALAQEYSIHRGLLVNADQALTRNERTQAMNFLSRIPANSVYADRAQKMSARISESARAEQKGPKGEVKLTPEEDKALKAKYPNPKLLPALLAYVKADFDGAAAALIVKGRPVDPAAVELQKSFRNVRLKEAEGAVAAQASDVEKALKSWDEAIALDEKLIPPPVRSQPRVEVRRMMGDTLYRAGYHAFIRGNYLEAFTNWKRGMERSPDNYDIYAGFSKLDQTALGMLAEADRLFEKDPVRACARLKETQALTREQTPVNAKIGARLAEKCPTN